MENDTSITIRAFVLGLLLLLGTAGAVAAPRGGRPSGGGAGALAGRVTADGYAVAGAQVVATKIPEGATYRSVTDSSGHYRFPQLDTGVYKVRISQAGFMTLLYSIVPVLESQSEILDARLRFGSSGMQITIHRALVRMSTARHSARPHWKSRAEYRAFEAFHNEKDPGKQLARIRVFLRGYPASDFKMRAYADEMRAYEKLDKHPQADQSAKKKVKADPGHLRPVTDVQALYILAVDFPANYDEEASDARTQLDNAIAEAQFGLSLLRICKKPADRSDHNLSAFLKYARETFHETIGFADIEEGRYQDAITELKGVPAELSGGLLAEAQAGLGTSAQQASGGNPSGTELVPAPEPGQAPPAAQPAPSTASTFSAAGRDNGPMQGVEVKALTAGLCHQLGLAPDTRGVVVASVMPGSPAAGELGPGDVIQELNRKSVFTVAEYKNAVRANSNEPAALVKIIRHGMAVYLAVAKTAAATPPVQPAASASAAAAAPPAQASADANTTSRTPSGWSLYRYESDGSFSGSLILVKSAGRRIWVNYSADPGAEQLLSGWSKGDPVAITLSASDPEHRCTYPGSAVLTDESKNEWTCGTMPTGGDGTISSIRRDMETAIYSHRSTPEVKIRLGNTDPGDIPKLYIVINDPNGMRMVENSWRVGDRVYDFFPSNHDECINTYDGMALTDERTGQTVCVDAP